MPEETIHYAPEKLVTAVHNSIGREFDLSPMDTKAIIEEIGAQTSFLVRRYNRLGFPYLGVMIRDHQGNVALDPDPRLQHDMPKKGAAQ